MATNCPQAIENCECRAGKYPHLCKGIQVTACYLTRTDWEQVLALAAQRADCRGTGPFKKDVQPARMLGEIVHEWLASQRQ